MNRSQRRTALAICGGAAFAIVAISGAPGVAYVIVSIALAAAYAVVGQLTTGDGVERQRNRSRNRF